MNINKPFNIPRANVEEYRVVFMEYVDFVDWKVWKFRIDKDVRGIWKKILQAVDAIHEKGARC